MGIWINEEMPVTQSLTAEKIAFGSLRETERFALKKLRIAVVNIMPLKEATELQLLRMLAGTPQDMEVTFLRMASHQHRNVSLDYLLKYYKTLADIRHQHYDGLIITGAPVERLPFEGVDYWPELREILDWSLSQVTSTLHLCWSAQAGLYHHYGIQKHPLPGKLSGIYLHRLTASSRLTRGFDDEFFAPHSRFTQILREEIEEQGELEILSESAEAGVYIVYAPKGRQVFVTGHPEYDKMTLACEYQRDLKKGLEPALPKNYYPLDDPRHKPISRWSGHASLLFANWLNYFVN